jgi:hypothetical protein
MTFDNDVLNSRASTYRFSMNGRTIFNKDGTHSWQTENGSKVSFKIEARGGTDGNKYIAMGNTGNNNIVLLFSADELNGNSEIGLLSIDEAGVGSYKTLFNDQDDPNGDKLNFHTYNQIEARFVFENPKMIRGYWIDGVEPDSNQPRTITFSFDETLGLPQSDVNAYSADNISVHAMNTQSEFSMGLIKYVMNVGGSLLTGVYQYSYSLGTESGYNTPWYPLSRRVFVSSDDVSNTNWNDYEMGGSGIESSKGNRIQIKGIDERFDRIRVAYAYSKNSTSINSTNIFLQTNISSDVMEFDHVSNSGEPLLPEELTELFSGIVAAKTLNIKDSTLYFGNVKENFISVPDLEPILQNLVVKPIFKDMRSDENLNNNDNKQKLPITNQKPRNGITQMKLHDAAGGVEDYTINNDYVNYKGTQIDHLYAAHFRGETYRYALVIYDKLGFESFAFHLCDFNFPNQSEDIYSWNRVKADGGIVSDNGVLPQKAWPTNNFNDVSLRDNKVLVGDVGNTPGSQSENLRQVSHIKIMGVEFSGIDLSSLGNLAGGFKIVRVKRDSSILLQGLIMPCVSIVDDKDGSIIEPNPTTAQRIADFNQPYPHIPIPTSGIANIEKPGGGDIPFETHASPNERYRMRSNVSVFYAPAIDFGSTNFPSLQTQDKMTLVGGCWDEDAWKAIGSWRHYSKFYYSKNNFHNGDLTNEASGSADPYPQYMAELGSIDFADKVGLGDFIPDWDLTTRLNNNCQIQNQTGGEDQDAHGKSNSIFLKHGNFNGNRNSPTNGVYAPFYNSSGPNRAFNDDGGSMNNQFGRGGSFIANYRRPNPNPYGGLTLSSLEQSIFIGTGHFQPINNLTFNAQGMPSDLIFNGIEVFGGDCYLDYHSFLRLYPQYTEDTEDKDKNAFSVGCVFPFEYEFNHALREAPSKPSATFDNIGPKWFGAQYSHLNRGLYSGVSSLVEEFDLNSVLAFEELLLFFNPKPLNFIDNTLYPVRWRYTREKVYGDTVDNWRLFQVNDFKDLNGSYGEITSSLYLMNQIYSWQIGAFGRLRASDRALLESQQGGTLSTGIGDKLDGVDYVSTEYGNQHQWSLFKSDTAAYWIDVNKRKIMKFAQDGKNPLSDIKGVHQFLEYELPLFEDHDSPANGNGIHGTFDYGNNEALFTFVRDRRISTPNVNTDIVIRSRTGQGKAYVSGVVEHNQTAIIAWDYDLQPNNGILLPVGNQSIGVNENFIFYLKIKGGDVNVFNHDAGVNTLLASLENEKYYKFWRHSIEDAWSYAEVENNDVTPEVNTITYSEIGNFFSGFHSYKPSHYISTKFLVLSNDSYTGYSADNEILVHDMGKKSDFPSFSNKSVLEISVNEAQMIAKAFDSLRVNCNKDFSDHLNTFLMNTDSQFHFIDMASDNRKKYLEDILRFPLRSKTQKDRMRGKHMLMTFELKNNQEYNDRITNLVTHYRPSNRM